MERHHADVQIFKHIPIQKNTDHDIQVWPRAHEESKKIENLIGRMMIHIVCGEGFRELMHYLDPRYRIPHLTTFSRSIVPKIYKNLKPVIKNEFKMTL